MNQVKQWKHKAISNAGAISDGFSVFIAWMGHISVWVLFVCMVLNIIQVLPSVHFWQPVIDAIMAVEIITLDIAGFGLRSIAKSMLKQTDDAAVSGTANWANTLACILIFITISTVALIAIGWLFPNAKSTTDNINNGLILVRIIFIVLFMHTMYELREAEAEIQEQTEKQAKANDQLLLDISRQVEDLTHERDRLQASHQSEQKSLRSMIDGLREEQQSLRSTVDQQESIIDQQKSTMRDLQKSTIDQEALSFTIDQQQATIDLQHDEIQSLRSMVDQRSQVQETLYAEIDHMRATINGLQSQLQKSTDRPENRPSEKSTIDLKKSTAKSTGDTKASLSKQPIDFQKSLEGLSKKSTDTRETIKKFIEDATKENRPFTYDDICESTGFSIQTVKKYGPSIKKELGLTSNTDEAHTDPEIVAIND